MIKSMLCKPIIKEKEHKLMKMINDIFSISMLPP